MTSRLPTEHLDRMSALSLDGLSASEIGDAMWHEFGVYYSRSAIVGLWHRGAVVRNGRKSGPRKRRARTVVAALKPAPLVVSKLPARRPPTQSPMVFASEPLPAATQDDLIPDEQRVSLFDLRDGVCRWPVGNPGAPDFFFCGSATKPESPYCREHHARAFIPRSR